ncbi:MAG: DUF1684 domain-containing protein, partial [Candidatus Limnocylindria bacterium]
RPRLAPYAHDATVVPTRREAGATRATPPRRPVRRSRGSRLGHSRARPVALLWLWDTAKGTDLGSADDELVLDFNYAYHPSCVYDPQWSCPLAPPTNRLGIPIRAGERLSRL